MPKTVQIYIAKDKIEAHILRDLLESAGIPVYILGQNLHGMAGELPAGAATAPRLWVHHEDAIYARQIIEDYESSITGS